MRTNKTRTILGALCLLGVALLVVGLFLPWLQTSTSPSVSVSSFWQIAVVLTSAIQYGPLFLLIALTGAYPPLLIALIQLGVAIAALQGRAIRIWAGISLFFALVISALYLFWGLVAACLFGQATACGYNGAYSLSDYTHFYSGFWMMLAGLAVFLVCDIALLIVGSPRAQTAAIPSTSAL